MKKIILPFVLLLICITAICQNPLLLKDVYPGATGSGIQQIVKTTGYTFFNAEDDDPDADRGLYRTDGTPGGTIKLNLSYLPDPPPSPNNYASTKAEKLTALGNKVIFAGDNFAPGYGEVWASDGTQAGTVALERFQPTIANTRGPVFDMAAMGGYVYYAAVASNNKTQIRRTDGTPGGTSLVYEFSTFNTAPEAALFKVINNVLYFNMYDNYGAGNDMVWRTDGTAAGTYMLRDMGTEYFLMGFFMEPVNGSICFMTGKFSNNNTVLFKTDGTPAGTVPVYEFAGIFNNNLYPAYALIGNTLYFTAFENINGKELWKTDGTTAGTMLVADIMPGASSSIPLNLTNFNNQLYFSARISGVYKFYKLEGNTPVMVKDITPLNGVNGNSAYVISSNNLVFNATTAANGAELWISDGTTANTLLVADINPGINSSNPLLLTPGNPVYFSANNGVNGSEIFRFNNPGILSNTLYVNDGTLSGDVYTSAIGNNSNSGSAFAPFATIQYAIDHAQPGDVIYVDAGTYAERIFVSKPLTIKGAYFGTNPGSSLSRGSSESILIPATENNLSEIITVQAADVSIDGFLFNGDNPTISGTITLNGVDVNAGMGIYNNNVQTDRLVVKNNIFKNFYRYAMLIQKGAGTPLSALSVSRNRIDNISSKTGREGRAIGLFSNIYGSVTENILTRVYNGILIANYLTGSTESLNINNNTVQAYNVGIFSSNNGNFTSAFNVNNNNISVADLATWSAPGSSTVNTSTGINILVRTTSDVSLSNNTISGTQNGIFLNGITTPTGININGGSVSNCTGVGVFYIANSVDNARLKISNLSLNNNDVGIDASYSSGSALPLEFNNTTITGGATGLRLYGSQVSVPGNVLSGVSFSGQSAQHILLTVDAFTGQTIDATTVQFNGLTGADMTLAQLLATEDKIVHKVDNEPFGFIRVKSGEVFLTENSFYNLPVFGSSTTTPSLERAINSASTADIVNVGAGLYNTADLTLNKALTFLGPNASVTPNDPANKLLPNTSRNAEAVISGATFNIATNNLSFKGFTFDPGNKSAFVLANTAATNSDFGNFSFEKNMLKISNTTANLNQFAITGKFVSSPNLPVTSGYTIADNRFEKSGSATGNTLNLNYLKNISVNNNTFLVTGTTLRTQQVLNLGSTGLVSELTFSNNSIEDASTVAGGNKIASALMAGNKMHNINSPLSNTNTMPESSSIEFSNNIVGNDLGTPFMLYTRSGSSLAGTSNLLKLENNTFTGVSTAPDNQLFATTNFTINNSVLNPSVIISSNKFTYSGDFSAQDPHFFRPITVRGNVGYTTIENNEVLLNNTGGMAPFNPSTNLPENPAITIGTDNSNFAYMTLNAVVNILNNKIHGFKNSVAFYDASNNIRDTYTGYGNIPVGAVVNINNNSFTGDVMSVNNGTFGQTVNATCNWYGTAAAQSVVTKITPSTVNYIPWLVDGTDVSATTGFQPIAGICNGTPVVAVVTQSTNITCNGANDGSINVTISGGSTPYSFAWSKDNVAGFSTQEDISALAPGSYQLVVTDANGSTATVSAEITQPDILIASATGTNVSCFGGSNGSATVTANGGTAQYTYLWSNAATTSSINGLTAGNYSVTVTDANGCQTNTSYTVTQPTILVAAITDNSTVCANNATAVGTGGTPSYTYLWSNGATTAAITNVPAATYTVTVTDANGCTKSASIILTVKDGVKPTAQVTDVSCFGGSNGVFTVTNAQGAAPFMYSLNNGASFQTGNVFSNLTAGTYTALVKDANNCVGFVTKTINQHAAIVITLNSIQHLCFGGGNGSISINVTGGSGGNNYSWSGPGGFTSTSKNINNLTTPGNYTVTVTDNNGCTKQFTATLLVAAQIVVTAQLTNLTCKGAGNGAISIVVSGGSGSGFTFSWSGPGGFSAASQNISNLAAGKYDLTVTDATGCTTQRSYTLTEPSAVTLSTSHTNATGCNSLGKITATATGGTSPYQFKLNNGIYQSSGSFTGLYAGSYVVTARDANGCTDIKTESISDNGDDDYEKNDTKSKAAAILIASTVNARIAVGSDPADWFKFTTPSGSGNYILSLSHPSASFTFNMYAAGNNTPALVPVATTATSKEYTLAGSTTYYISVTGGLSYICYDMMVAPPTSFTRTDIITKPVSENNTGDKNEEISIATPEVPSLSATAFPNPHQGTFKLQINSPEAGNARIELFTVNGQKLQEKTVLLQKTKSNIVPFIVSLHGTIFYRIVVGKNIITGKITGME